MYDIIETFKVGDKVVEIVRDPDPQSPRKDCSFLSGIAHWHRKYDLGEKIERMTEAEMREHESDIIAILPLYLFDHSGIAINTTGFSCRWDSGQVGWAFVTRDSAEQLGCADWSEEKLLAAIVDEVETYNRFITGEVFGYCILDATGEEISACWGYFGTIPEVCEEARRAVR